MYVTKYASGSCTFQKLNLPCAHFVKRKQLTQPPSNLSHLSFYLQCWVWFHNTVLCLILILIHYLFHAGHSAIGTIAPFSILCIFTMFRQFEPVSDLVATLRSDFVDLILLSTFHCPFCNKFYILVSMHTSYAPLILMLNLPRLNMTLLLIIY